MPLLLLIATTYKAVLPLRLKEKHVNPGAILLKKIRTNLYKLARKNIKVDFTILYRNRLLMAAEAFSTLVTSRPYSATCTVPPIDTLGLRYNIPPSTDIRADR